MNAECQLEYQGSQPTLAVWFRAPVSGLKLEFKQAYATLANYLLEVAAKAVSPPYAIYHDGSSSELEIEAGVAVDRALAGKGKIRSGRSFEGEVATMIHTGPYETIGSTYSALKDWMHGHGLTDAGPITEYYLDDPSVTPPGEIRTKIAIPIESA